MNIVYHASDSFAKVTGTSIVSIFENNKDIDEINVYVIEKILQKIIRKNGATSR